MRAFFVVLVVILLLVSTAFVLLPMLLDVHAVRGIVVRNLETATGRDVVVAEGGQLELFPRPRLSLPKIDIAGANAEGADVSMSLDRLDLQLALFPLLRGQVVVHHARLVRPLFRLPTRISLASLLSELDAASNAEVETRVTVVDGTLALQSATDPSAVEIGDIDVEGAYDAASRNLDLSGRGRHNGIPLKLDLHGTGSTGAASFALELSAGQNEQAHVLKLQGVARAQDGKGSFAGELDLTSSNGARLAQYLEEAVGPELDRQIWLPAAPIQLAGHLSWSDEGSSQFDGRVTLPAGELELSVVSAGADALQLVIEGNQLSLSDELGSEIGRWLLEPDIHATRPMTVEVHLGHVALRGAEFRDLRLDVRTEQDGSIVVERAQAVLPARGELNLHGEFAPAQGGRTSGEWQGTISILAPEILPVLAALGIDSTAFDTERFKGLTFESSFSLNRERLELVKAQARMDASALSGSAMLVLEPTPRLQIEAAADRLDLGAYLGPTRWVRLRDWLEDLLKVEGRQGLSIALNLDFDQLSWVPFLADKVSLRAEAGDGVINIKELSVRNIAGASVRLDGVLDNRVDRVEITGALDAPNPMRLIRLAGLPVPVALVGFGTTQARANFTGTSTSGELDAHISTEIGDIDIRGAIDRPFDMTGYDVSMSAQSASVSDFFTALGAVGFDQPVLEGALDLGVGVRREGPEAPVNIDLAIAMGDTTLGGTLELREEDSQDNLQGTLEVEQLDPQTLLDGYRFLEPVAGLVPGPIRSWPGNWPSQPLDWTWLRSVNLNLDTSARLIADGDQAPVARARLTLNDDRLMIDGIDVPAADGKLQGSVGFGWTDGPTMELALEAKNVDGAAFLHGLRAGRGLSGRLDLALDGKSRGLSLLDFVRNMDGRGRLKLSSGAIEGLRLTDIGLIDVAGENLRYGELSGDYQISRGIASIANAPLTLELADGRRIDVWGSFDLAAWMVNLKLLPTQPSEEGAEALALIGPPDRLQELGSSSDTLDQPATRP